MSELSPYELQEGDEVRRFDSLENGIVTYANLLTVCIRWNGGLNEEIEQFDRAFVVVQRGVQSSEVFDELQDRLEEIRGEIAGYEDEISDLEMEATEIREKLKTFKHATAA